MAGQPTTQTDQVLRARGLAIDGSVVYHTAIRSARHYRKHWHATYGLGCIHEGAQESASGRGRVEAQAGSLITNNPGEVHDGRPYGSDRRTWEMIYVEPEFLSALADEAEHRFSGQLELPQPVFEDPLLKRSLLTLFARAARAPDTNLGVEEALSETLALLLLRHVSCADGRSAESTRDASRVGAASPGLERVRALLADAPEHNHSLAHLASLAGVGRFQLLRAFRREYGLPPHAWLRSRRAELARRLITTGVPLAEAAIHSGFSDQSHMTRAFSAHFGVTPAAYKPSAQ